MENAELTPPFQSRVIKEMSAGAIGMAITSVLLNPLGVIKVRIQRPGAETRSMILCAKQSVSHAGGVWRGLILPGLTATLIRDSLNGAFRIGLYREAENMLFPASSETPVLVKKLITGIIVGSTGSGLWSHTDLVRTRMQLQDPQNPKYSSTWDCYKKVAKTEGIRGLYRGAGPNMIRASIITTSHIGSYDASKRMISSYLGDNTVTWTLCGFLSALVVTTAAAPVDLLSTRIMAYSTHKASFLTVLKQVFRSEGLSGLYRGWVPSFTRFGPHFTMSWPLIELSRKYIFGLDSF
jgi:dicarboxylate transporter 10